MNDFEHELRRLESAIDQGESGPAGPSGYVYHLYQHAVMTGRREELALAELRLEQLMRRVGPRSDLCLLQAHIHVALHRFDAARRALERSSGLLGSAWGRALAADLDVQAGRYAQAAEAYAAVIAQDDSWDNIARLAYVKGLLGVVDEADALYASAESELTAKHMRAYAWLELQRGQLAFKRGDFATTEQRYLRARAAYSGYWLIDEYRAELLGARRAWEPARALYRDILQRVDRPEVWHASADLSAAAGYTAEAAVQYERALANYLRSVEQGDVHYVHHLAEFYLEVRHDPCEGLRWAKRDLELRTNAQTLSAVAWALHLADASDSALELVCVAEQSGIVDAELFRQWATIHAACGRAAQAERWAAAATRLNPHLDRFHVHR